MNARSRLGRFARLALALVLPLAPLALPGVARAAGDGPLRVDVLVGGVPLQEHFARGTAYVEALRGREYSVRLTNLTGERLAVGLAVDGRNSIDASRGSAREARKWVLGPWDSIVVDGWQTSDATANRFTFTTEERSYAEWLGDASAAGSIEAIAYRERGRDVSHWSGPRARESGDSRGSEDDGWSESRRRQARAEVPAQAPAAGAARDSAASGMGKLERADAQSARPTESEADHDAAATGFGRTVDHDVRRVAFDAEDWPAATVRVRYEYRDALVRLGVLPDRSPRSVDRRREHASGFTDGPWCPTPR